MSQPITILGVLIGTAESISTTSSHTYHGVSLNPVGMEFLGPLNLESVSTFDTNEPENPPNLQFLFDIGEVLVLVPDDRADDDSDDSEPLRIQWKPHWKNLMSHLKD